jgi:lysophospholipase L1-like esterase
MPGERRTTAGLYVAVGASDAVGVGARRPRTEAWPRLLHRRCFGRRTRFVNLGVPGATAASALAGQVPRAVPLRPDVVTVWLVVNDVIAGVAPDGYEAVLDELVGRLRDGDESRLLLVGNCPHLDRLPAYLAGWAAGLLPEPAEANRIVDRYNEAIERVVARQGATLVDLRAAGLAARRAGLEAPLFAADGFHPSTAGHRAIAAAFAAVLAAVPRPAGAPCR